jgi:predicted DNA-binding mobile mystery protein A
MSEHIETNMKISNVIREQCAQQVNGAAKQVPTQMPQQGWIKTVRVALGMSGAALSSQLGMARSGANYLERAEQDGSITLKKLSATAEAMNCKLVYAIVPTAANGHTATIEQLIEQQAQLKAAQLSNYANIQMALESQQLDPKAADGERQRLVQQFVAAQPKDFWLNT